MDEVEKKTEREVERFLSVEVSEARAQKKILEGVGAVSMDGMPKGSRKTEDGTQMHYEELCEELRCVEMTLSLMSCEDAAICQGLVAGKLDKAIYIKLGYSASHYYHTMKKRALMQFSKLYPLKDF